jgi:predicted nucleic acid-binding protein
MSVLADTSGIIALLDAGDPYYEQARRYMDDLIIPSSILCEVDYLATKYYGSYASRRFFASVARGDFNLLHPKVEDVRRAYEVMEQYAGSEIGFVDASLVALAERQRIRRVLTLDKRHFIMFRPKGLGYLELLP